MVHRPCHNFGGDSFGSYLRVKQSCSLFHFSFVWWWWWWWWLSLLSFWGFIVIPEQNDWEIKMFINRISSVGKFTWWEMDLCYKRDPLWAESVCADPCAHVNDKGMDEPTAHLLAADLTIKINILGLQQFCRWCNGTVTGVMKFSVTRKEVT